MFAKIDIKKFGLYKDFTWHPVMMKDFDQVSPGCQQCPNRQSGSIRLYNQMRSDG